MGWSVPHPSVSIAASTAEGEKGCEPNQSLRLPGIDIGKKVFHVIALNAAGAIIQRAKFSRDTLIGFFETAPKALVGMEACPGSQWLARRLAAMGHDARIIPARVVKPYVKSNKSDTLMRRPSPRP